MSALARAATLYATRLGWFVFPTKPGSKQPHGRFVRHGFQDATRDLEQIERWWAAEPRAGVAVACAQSQLIVLDVDPRNGGDETLGRLLRELGPLPETPRVVTPGGGQHVYLRDTVGAYVGAAGEGLDVKHQGYVLAPPSLHPNGGTYLWDRGSHVLDVAVAVVPDRWLAHLTSRPKVALPSSGVDAADSWLAYAFRHMGWLGEPLPGGRRAVRCPWFAEHTDGRGVGLDSSSAILPPAEGSTFGGFHCAHAHCAGRTGRDVVAILPNAARWAADQAVRRAQTRLTLERLSLVRRARNG